jgi:hypothetical protein
MCEIRHALFPELPEFKEGDRVMVQFNLGGELTIAKCRIRAVKYWYHRVVYDVFSLEDNGSVWFGFKDHVFPDKVVGLTNAFK